MGFILSECSPLSRVSCPDQQEHSSHTERALQRLTQLILGLIEKEVPTGNACLPPLQRILASKF